MNNILLFPGEKYNFTRTLLPFKIFSFNNKNNSLISKKFSVLSISNTHTNDNAYFIGKFYFPIKEDTIVGVITQKSYEYYKVDINSSKEGILNCVDFEGATKKERPNLEVGDIVYCRVLMDSKYENCLLTCKSENNNKSWSSGESTYGQLKGGYLYNLSPYLCYKLIQEEDNVIKRIQDYLEVDIRIGLNGKLWIYTSNDDIQNNTKIYDAIIESFKLNKNKMEKYLNNIFNN